MKKEATNIQVSFFIYRENIYMYYVKIQAINKLHLHVNQIYIAQHHIHVTALSINDRVILFVVYTSTIKSTSPVLNKNNNAFPQTSLEEHTQFMDYTIVLIIIIFVAIIPRESIFPSRLCLSHIL